MTKRADIILVERGFFDSRAKAQAAIAAGLVKVDDTIIAKPSMQISENAVIEAQAAHPYVSRGALKLNAALAAFNITALNKTCLDIGASTGGFCDVLLKAGAKCVYAVDVGHGQLHPSLASDPRIVNLEGIDARSLSTHIVPEKIDLLVCDVSFISLRLVIPPLLPLLNKHAALALLIKPQFEAGRAHLKKGIIRDPGIHEMVCTNMKAFITGLGFDILGLVPSPITGRDGNREFLLGAYYA